MIAYLDGVSQMNFEEFFLSETMFHEKKEKKRNKDSKAV